MEYGGPLGGYSFTTEAHKRMRRRCILRWSIGGMHQAFRRWIVPPTTPSEAVAEEGVLLWSNPVDPKETGVFAVRGEAPN